MTPDQEPRPDCTCGAYWDGDLSVPHSAGCAMGVRERAERNVLEQKAILDLHAETDGPDQEPRTSGVAVVRGADVAGCPMFIAAAPGFELPNATHLAFPLAEAEALIDPNDPAVLRALRKFFDQWTQTPSRSDAIADAVLAALRGAK